ncbi:MAG: FprA family A-type flavoprotein [Oscillospiraceae bacterium]|nr:FprA family A-type flavoprotein [Oscillospiraceae bacterium]
MPVVKISDSISYVGILNPILRIFDVVMKTEYGTTYNSYVVKGSEKTALVETCHLSYFEQYLKNIREVTKLEDIDYIILNHCEPDHSGALARLLELCPKAEIYVTRAASIYLNNITNGKDLPVHIVKDGEELSLGDKTLRFIPAPFLHWPDSMFTYLPEEKAVFTCDFLGSHYCEPHITDDNIVYPKKYEDALAYYYAAIFGPFPAYVRAGLEKLRGLEFDTALTSHGPVLSRGEKLPLALEKYAEWSEEKVFEKPLIPVFYCSAYGNTGKIAEAIAEGIREAKGDCACNAYDLNDHDMSTMSDLINSATAICIGSPTINADAVAPVWQLLSHVDAINSKKKPALVFGSYGWSGEAVPNIAARLAGLKMNVFGEGYKVCFVPSDEDLESARELGRSFANSF